MSASILQYTKTGGGYQSISTADSTLSSSVDIEKPLSKLRHHRRCCHQPIKYKSFTYGIILGLLLAYASTIYDGIKYLIRYERYQHHIKHHSASSSGVAINYNHKRRGPHHSHPLHNLLYGPHYHAKVSIGPRPYFLINEMDDDDDGDNSNSGFKRPGLKRQLEKCTHTLKTLQPSTFVLGHRGAALQFPEHTDRSHDGASRMGAGLVECDINLTKDRQLVCRHLRCDLHLTTNVLAIPHLAAKCTQPFHPAIGPKSASAKCCTTDFTLHEIQNMMCGKMSSGYSRAKTVQQYITHTPSYRTDLYSHDCPRIQSHADFMKVIDANGGSYVPEFKMLDYDFTKRNDGYTRQSYIEQIIDEYNTTDPVRVYPQGFIWEDLYYVVSHTNFGMNTFALDKNYMDIVDMNEVELRNYLRPLVDHGVPAVAPTMFMLLDVNEKGNVVPSLYAKVARELGLDIIAWTLERGQSLSNGGGWYYEKLSSAINTDSDMIKILDVLYEDVGIKAVFTDWPSVVTFYANCKGIGLM